MAAIVVDIGNAYAQKRSAQRAADAASLAAVQEVTPALGDSCDATCMSAVRASIAAAAQDYSAENGGPSVLDGGTYPGDSSRCQYAADDPDPSHQETNCYAWPYDGSNGKVEVRLHHDAATFFARSLGFAPGFLEVNARAVAKATPITEEHCYIDGELRDDLLPDCEVPGPPLPGSNPSLLYVKDPVCKAVHLVAADTSNPTIFYGAITINGTYDIDPGAQGDLLRWRNPTEISCAGNLPPGNPPANGAWIPAPNTIGPRTGGTQGAIEEVAALTDWPIPNPTLSDCANPTPWDCVPTAATKVQERDKFGAVIDEEPCSKEDGTPGLTNNGWSVDENTLIPGHVYCNATVITVKDTATPMADPLNLGVGFAAPKVIFESGVGVKPFQGLYYHGTPGACDSVGGLLMFAWGKANGAAQLKGNNTWGGGIFVPNGDAAAGGKGGVSTYGFIQAKGHIDFGTDGAIFYGTGRCESGGGTGPPIQGTITSTVTGATPSLDE